MKHLMLLTLALASSWSMPAKAADVTFNAGCSVTAGQPIHAIVPPTSFQLTEGQSHTVYKTADLEFIVTFYMEPWNNFTKVPSLAMELKQNGERVAYSRGSVEHQTVFGGPNSLPYMTCWGKLPADQ